MQSFWRIIGGIIRLFGLQNVILLEAERVKRENTDAVFRELLHRGWNKRYQIALVSEDPSAIDRVKEKHVSIIKRPTYRDNWVSKMRMRWLRLRSCMIIDENKQIKKMDAKTTHVFLSHGSCVKRIREYYNCTPDTDYMLNQSIFWKPINEYELKISQDKLVTLGFPRNDILITSQLDLVELFGKTYKKIVAWYPTYRQLQGHREIGVHGQAPSIPIIHDERSICLIDAYAAKYNVLLVVKPHPAQDVTFIRDIHLDHLIMVNDQFFLNHQTTDYAFLAKTDALITDYSSVVFDYLLTQKPIALTLEDYEQYKEQIGFAIDMGLLRSCATPLNSAEDFETFFGDLVAENDPLREQRLALMRLTNQYTDGNSTERVVDWLETLLKK